MPDARLERTRRSYAGTSDALMRSNALMRAWVRASNARERRWDARGMTANVIEGEHWPDDADPPNEVRSEPR